MKDEIKEMIDKIKKCLIAGYDLDIITQKEMDILWNYINNLQTIEQQYSAILSENAELENKITNLQEENKRLKELDENYPIEEQLEEALKYENIYKSRSEKAIEFVKKESRKCYTNQPSENPLKVIGNFMWHTDKLLNILQGEDKDE